MMFAPRQARYTRMGATDLRYTWRLLGVQGVVYVRRCSVEGLNRPEQDDCRRCGARLVRIRFNALTGSCRPKKALSIFHVQVELEP